MSNEAFTAFRHRSCSFSVLHHRRISLYLTQRPKAQEDKSAPTKVKEEREETDCKHRKHERDAAKEETQGFMHTPRDAEMQVQTIQAGRTTTEVTRQGGDFQNKTGNQS